MFTPLCPRCHAPIPGDEISVLNDVAFCRACNLVGKLSEIVNSTELDMQVDVLNPPTGTWHRDNGRTLIVGASHRSLTAAAGLLAVSLFWNGIVSVFVFLALNSTLQLLGVSVPDWFPAPRMNGKPMNWGVTVFLWVFLTPFMLIGLTMIGAFLSALCGKTEVEVGSTDSSVFTGIGRLGWRKRFKTKSVQNISINTKIVRARYGGESEKPEILMSIHDNDPVKFGSGLSEARLKFMAAVLRRRFSH